jgi:hypothetical protein
VKQPSRCGLGRSGQGTDGHGDRATWAMRARLVRAPFRRPLTANSEREQSGERLRDGEPIGAAIGLGGLKSGYASLLRIVSRRERGEHCFDIRLPSAEWGGDELIRREGVSGAAIDKAAAGPAPNRRR